MLKIFQNSSEAGFGCRTARRFRNQLNRLSACDAAQAAPGLFAIIKQEGKV